MVLNSKVKLRVYTPDLSEYREVTGLTPITMGQAQDIEGYSVSGYTWAYRVLTNSESSEKNTNMAKALYAFMKAAENLNVVDVASVTIDNAPTETMTVGDTLTLSATVSPDNATDKTVTWSSDTPSVVSIDEATGEITAMGLGTATITAKATGATEELTDTFVVTVNKDRIATPGRMATNYLTVPGASAENPIYFTGTYTGSVTSESVAYYHGTAGSYDELYFNGARIYRGNWNVGSALEITGGSGTQSDPYVITRV